MTDADNLSPIAREQTLLDQLDAAGDPAIGMTEPIIIFTPKWQVESWIKCLLGQIISEEDKESDKPPVDSTQIRHAAETLYGWTRKGAQASPACVASLRASLPKWTTLS
jgi:hypothetical protein